MKLLTLNNHRKLNQDEVIRVGDILKGNDGKLYPAIQSAGNRPSTYTVANEFYRRRHTKKKETVKITFTPYRVGGHSGVFKKAVPSQSKKMFGVDLKPERKTPKMPVVLFCYPKRGFRYAVGRIVKVISLDETYLTGLERTIEADKIKYQFKKFLVSRIWGEIRLESY